MCSFISSEELMEHLSIILFSVNKDGHCPCIIWPSCIYIFVHETARIHQEKRLQNEGEERRRRTEEKKKQQQMSDFYIYFSMTLKDIHMHTRTNQDNLTNMDKSLIQYSR